MPLIKDFGGFRIRMYFGDHNPPHCHIDSADYAALVSIENAAVFEGAIDPSFRKEALTWVAENKSFLMGKWNELHPG